MQSFLKNLKNIATFLIAWDRHSCHRPLTMFTETLAKTDRTPEGQWIEKLGLNGQIVQMRTTSDYLSQQVIIRSSVCTKFLEHSTSKYGIKQLK